MSRTAPILTLLGGLQTCFPRLHSQPLCVGTTDTDRGVSGAAVPGTNLQVGLGRV